MICPMKKLLLAAKTSNREQVLSQLKKAAVVHVDPIDPESVRIPEGLSKEIDDCTRVISLLEQKGESANANYTPPGTPSRIIEEVLTISRKIDKGKETLAHLKKEIEALTPWGKMSLDDIKFLIDNGLDVKLFTGPADKIDEITADVWQIVSHEDSAAWFIAAAKDEVKLGSSFALVEMPDRDINTIDNEMVNIERNIEEGKQSLACFALRLDDLRSHYLKLLNKKRYFEVETGIFKEDEIFVLSGWCPSENIEDLSQSFEKAGVKVGLQFDEPDEKEIPPTLLKNSAWARSIGPLYEFMGMTPSYDEPDTSGLFLIMLSVFSAFLLADAGYGLIVFLAAVAAYLPLVKRGFDKDALKLVLFLFGAVAIYGLLTNTWFGENYRLVENYKFDPTTDEGMIFLQGICFLMGVCHLTLGHLMKMSRRKIDITVLSEVGWIMFLWAMYGVVCSLILKQDFVMPGSWVIPLFKLSAILILFFTAPSWNLFSCFAAGIGAILKNASSCFSDIVSYIRLWAVGLAGGKVAVAFNDIAAMVPYVILRIPIYVGGHAINIILGIIAILAHGVRLNLLEFSNHLELDWSGRKYDPFKEIK